MACSGLGGADRATSRQTFVPCQCVVSRKYAETICFQRDKDWVEDRGCICAETPGGYICHVYHVSVQASEEELFGLFSPIGEILELYILRNSNGKSRGCAFVTYANKYLAQQAITQLNGKQV